MPEAVILSAVRTPVGRYGGGLAGVRPDDLAAIAVGAAVERAGVPADGIEDVWLGCANQAGEDNRNVARFAALLAGLPDIGRRRDRQPALRLGTLGDRRRLPRGDRGRRRPVRRGRRGVDEPRAARHREARRGLPARRPDDVRHHARLAVRQPPLRRAVLDRVDGRHRRERRGALGRLPGGPGRLRARVAAPLGGRGRRGPLRGRARLCRRARARRASAARHERREARVVEARVPRGRHGHRRKRERDQRRRRGGGGRERGARAGARPRAARDVPRVSRRRSRPGRDGHRARSPRSASSWHGRASRWTTSTSSS